MRSRYMRVLFCRALTVRRLSILQWDVQIGFDSILCDIALLRPVASLTILRASFIPWLRLLLLLSSEPYVGVALDIEGEGDEDVANNGGNDADK